MISYVLGAPGSGKTAVVPALRPLLPGTVVLDWDAYMDVAADLAGIQLRQAPHIWDSYAQLIRTIVGQIAPVPVVLLTVCTPEQLRGWPPGRWYLLDCADEERRARLAVRADPAETERAADDAAIYRSLNLTTIDSTSLAPDEVALALADALKETSGRC